MALRPLARSDPPRQPDQAARGPIRYHRRKPRADQPAPRPDQAASGLIWPPPAHGSRLKPRADQHQAARGGAGRRGPRGFGLRMRFMPRQPVDIRPPASRVRVACRWRAQELSRLLYRGVIRHPILKSQLNAPINSLRRGECGRELTRIYTLRYIDKRSGNLLQAVKLARSRHRCSPRSGARPRRRRSSPGSMHRVAGPHTRRSSGCMLISRECKAVRQLTVQARLMLRPSTSADMGSRSLCSAPCLCNWAWTVRSLKL